MPAASNSARGRIARQRRRLPGTHPRGPARRLRRRARDGDRGPLGRRRAGRGRGRARRDQAHHAAPEPARVPGRRAAGPQRPREDAVVLPALRAAPAGRRRDRAVRPQLVQPRRRRARDGLLHRGRRGGVLPLGTRVRAHPHRRGALVGGAGGGQETRGAELHHAPARAVRPSRCRGRRDPAAGAARAHQAHPQPRATPPPRDPVDPAMARA